MYAQIVLKYLYLARIGNLIFCVSKEACSCHHEMDESMRQTFGTFDFLHSSHITQVIQAILSCGKHSTTM